MSRARLMQRTMFKGKIHRATVTEANLDYEGSVTIDAHLMELADIREFEEVHLWDVTNAARLTTYAIRGEPHSGVICVNGAAAHLIHQGDVVIIAAFARFDDAELESFQPRLVYVDAHNRPASNVKPLYSPAALASRR